MGNALESLLASGTKLWLDSIDPDLVREAKAYGATGATSNPIIVADLLKTGRFDDALRAWITEGRDRSEVAWLMTDRLVSEAQQAFWDVYQATEGNDGYVSFELDPLIEDPGTGLDQAGKVEAYVRLGKQWSTGHPNRMIKVPATEAGIASLEELASAAVPLNVTLIFSMRQYQAARDAIYRGIQRSDGQARVKSVYSIFVSRVDVYTAQHCPDLEAAQGWVGIVNSQKIWRENQSFWGDKGCRLQQEIVFASTGTKQPEDAKWKYVAALAGSDIQTNPPATNQAAASSGQVFTRRVDSEASAQILQEIDAHVDEVEMERVLMKEGLEKFARPQHELLNLIDAKRSDLM